MLYSVDIFEPYSRNVVLAHREMDRPFLPFQVGDFINWKASLVERDKPLDGVVRVTAIEHVLGPLWAPDVAEHMMNHHINVYTETVPFEAVDYLRFRRPAKRWHED